MVGNGSFIMHASTKIPPHSRCDATEPPFIVVLNHVTNRLLNVAIRLRSCMRKEKSMSTARSPLLMTRLTQRYEVAEGTTAFHLEKPAGWAFQVGQSLKNYTPESGGGRCRRRYSCVLNCECAARTIPMIIRLCDTAFERSLKSLTPQREVSIDGPFGINCRLLDQYLGPMATSNWYNAEPIYSLPGRRGRFANFAQCCLIAASIFAPKSSLVTNPDITTKRPLRIYPQSEQ